jgi:hypothetical protein
MPDVEVVYYLTIHRQENHATNLCRNRTKQIFHDQFDAHPKDDTDYMVMKEIDQDYNHEEYQAKTYLQQSLAFVVQ